MIPQIKIEQSEIGIYNRISQLLEGHKYLPKEVFKKVIDRTVLFVKENLQQGIDIWGEPVKSKKKKGRIFYKTGKLFNSPVSKNYGKEALIYLRSNRAEIGFFLNNGTPRIARKKFIGASPKLNTFIAEVINKELNGQ